jgi:hypothetical protein
MLFWIEKKIRNCIYLKIKLTQLPKTKKTEGGHGSYEQLAFCIVFIFNCIFYSLII